MWEPFRDALENLPGGGDTALFRETIATDGCNVGMLLWLTLHMTFDAAHEGLLFEEDLQPENRRLVAIVPKRWPLVPLRWYDDYQDAVGIVLKYLYNEVRRGRQEQSEPATDRYNLTELFLLPPIPKRQPLDDMD